MSNPTPNEKMAEKKAAAFRQSAYVFGGLALLTLIEFGLAGSSVALFVIGFGKAGLIVNYFMHISSLWSSEEH
jgi:hypothetical protein